MKTLKKSLALLLALMFVLPAGWMTSVVSYAGTNVVPVTAGDLVADNYPGFSEGESALLRSGLLAGETFERHRLTDDGTLVSVDYEKKTVSAVTRIVNGTVWVPVSVVLVYEGGSEEIALTEGEGAYAFDGKSFTVAVEYSAGFEIGAELQARLLNGPYYLAKAEKAVSRLEGFESSLFSLGSNIGTFAQLANKVSSQDTANAINSLAAESAENGGFLDLDLILLDYGIASSATEYMFGHSSEIKEAFSSLLSRAAVIKADPEIVSLIAGYSGRTAQRMRTVKNVIESFCNNFSDISESHWAVFSEEVNPLKAGLTADDYASLDTLIPAAEGAALHTDEIKGVLYSGSVSAEVAVNLCEISMTFCAEYVPSDVADSADTVELDPIVGTVRVKYGSTHDEVAAAVLASEALSSALGTWKAIDLDHFVMTLTGVEDGVTEDISATASFAPCEYSVTYDFEAGLPASVPYGYRMTLPIHEGDKLVYDYSVGGEAALQGEIVTITGDTFISRTEGTPWVNTSLDEIIAEVHKDILTDGEYGVLASGATVSDPLRMRKPTPDDVVVKPVAGGKFKITAPDVDAECAGMVWKAVSGAVSLDGEVVAELTFNKGVAPTVSALSIDSVSVKYVTEYKGASARRVLSSLDLPGILASEAAEQKEQFAQLIDLNDEFKQLDRVNFNRIKVAVKGSDMSDETKQAADHLASICFDENTEQLYLCEYIDSFDEQGLAYYYAEGNYEKIRSQIDEFKSTLTLIYEDEGFYDLLVENEYEYRYEEIGDMLDDLKEIKLTAPNPLIDPSSGSLEALADALEQVIGNSRAFDNGSPKALVIENDVDVDAGDYKLVYKIESYDFVLTSYEGLNLIRFAPGVLTTSAAIRASEDMVTVNQRLIEESTGGGEMRYTMPDGGVYSIWMRFDDGREIVLPGLDFTKIEAGVTVNDGSLNVVVNNLYGVKEYFIAKGTQTTLNDCKREPYNIVRIQATEDEEKAASKVGYFYKKAHYNKYLIDTFNISADETYTVCLNYFDGRDPVFLHFSIILPKPNISVLGLRATIDHLEGVKVVRVVEGRYDNYREVKRAPGVRNLALYCNYHDDQTYTVQFRHDGVYTLSIEYIGGYNKVAQIEISHLEPTFSREGNTVTFGDLDHLYVIKYSIGTYTTTAQMRAAGTVALQPGRMNADGEIKVTLAPGTYTFCVQYVDESLNFYYVTVD